MDPKFVIESVGDGPPFFAIATEDFERYEGAHSEGDEHGHEEGVGDGGGDVPPPSGGAPEAWHGDEDGEVAEDSTCVRRRDRMDVE